MIWVPGQSGASMTATETQHIEDREQRMAELVAMTRAHRGQYLRRRHIVRVAVGWACAAVFVTGYLIAAFSG